LALLDAGSVGRRKNVDEDKRSFGTLIGLCVALGAAVGAAIGAAADDPGLWIAVGAGVGVALGAAIDAIRSGGWKGGGR
jgi:hypothetical protein